MRLWVSPGLVQDCSDPEFCRGLEPIEPEILVMLCFHQILSLLNDNLALEFCVRSWYQHSKCFAECEIL